MGEVNLLESYPNPNRDLEWRHKNLTEEHRRIAKQFGRDYFDGDRLLGYGGYRYDGRWKKVAERFRDYYGLDSNSSVLDVGCAKGFLMHDLRLVVPGIKVTGIDISEYAIKNAMADTKALIVRANCKEIPFRSKSFDLVISINTVHNLGFEECHRAVAEIRRVSRNNAFLTVDAWHNAAERERLRKWVIIPDGTVLSTKDWEKMFKDVGYTGDYYWFVP